MLSRQEDIDKITLNEHISDPMMIELF